MDPFDDMREFCPFMEPISAYDQDERLEQNIPQYPGQNFPQRPRPNPDRIFDAITRNNPMIIRRLVNCGIPYPQAERIIKRIITITLSYCR